LDVERPAVFDAHLATVAPAKATVASKPAAAAPAGGLRLSADAGNALRFDRATLHAKAGKGTIRMDNPAVLEHNVAIKTASGRVLATGKAVGHGGVSVATATLAPGTYVFYCSLPGHEQAGMKGTLVVTR